MKRDQYLQHLERDGRRMVALAGGNLEVGVPTCPGWTLRYLVEHTGFVWRWMNACVRDETGEGPPDRTSHQRPPAAGQGWQAWLEEGLDALLDALRTADPGKRSWTWFEPDQTAGWFVRRATQETAVHRVDAERAALGGAEPIEPVLAVDGIEEMLIDVFVPASGPTPVGGAGETMHLHATDIEGEWLITLHPKTITVERGHAKADAALRATASDLLLFVWGRDPSGEVEHFGDASVRDRLFAACRL